MAPKFEQYVFMIKVLSCGKFEINCANVPSSSPRIVAGPVEVNLYVISRCSSYFGSESAGKCVIENTHSSNIGVRARRLSCFCSPMEEKSSVVICASLRSETDSPERPEDVSDSIFVK